MKTGLGILIKYRVLIAYINLIRFNLRKYLIGFDCANMFLQRTDKISILLILKANGAKIGSNCDLETGLIFHNCKNYSNLIIGNNCHIGKNCFFDLRDEIIIEHNVVISMQCTLITHMDISKSDLSKQYPSISKKIVLRNNSYIGARTTVLMGVEVGEGSIMGASSLVNKSIKSNSIYGGIPAKKIKK